MFSAFKVLSGWPIDFPLAGLIGSCFYPYTDDYSQGPGADPTEQLMEISRGEAWSIIPYIFIAHTTRVPRSTTTFPALLGSGASPPVLPPFRSKCNIQLAAPLARLAPRTATVVPSASMLVSVSFVCAMLLTLDKFGENCFQPDFPHGAASHQRSRRGADWRPISGESNCAPRSLARSESPSPTRWTGYWRMEDPPFCLIFNLCAAIAIRLL